MVKILIVEDERIVAEDVQKSLEKLGYIVSAIVSSGEEALQELKEDLPDLILMDIVLKGEMDGIDTAEVIRHQFGIPIIYLTAYADENFLQRAEMTEPYGYILKPFEDEEMRIILEKALHEKKGKP